MSTTLDHKAENGAHAVGVQIVHQMDGVDYSYGLAVKKKVETLIQFTCLDWTLFKFNM